VPVLIRIVILARASAIPLEGPVLVRERTMASLVDEDARRGRSPFHRWTSKDQVRGNSTGVCCSGRIVLSGVQPVGHVSVAGPDDLIDVDGSRERSAVDACPLDAIVGAENEIVPAGAVDETTGKR